MKYAKVHLVVITLLFFSKLLSAVMELLGDLKLSCNFMWKSQAGFAYSISSSFCHRLINTCGGMIHPLQI